MSTREPERRRRFDALFTSYSSDIVAYCIWRADAHARRRLDRLQRRRGSRLNARESGFKDGEALRVLPFGYVARDQAADPAHPLQTAVTVGPEGVVRVIAVTWGRGRTRSRTAGSARQRRRKRPRMRETC